MLEADQQVQKERCAVLHMISHDVKTLVAMEKLPQRDNIFEINLAQAMNTVILHQSSLLRNNLTIESSVLWVSEPDSKGVVDSSDEKKYSADFVRFVKGVDDHPLFKDNWMLQVKLPQGDYFIPVSGVLNIS